MERPDDEGEECVIERISGNAIYAKGRNTRRDFKLSLGPCSVLQVRGERELPAIGDHIFFKGRKEHSRSKEKSSSHSGGDSSRSDSGKDVDSRSPAKHSNY